MIKKTKRFLDNITSCNGKASKIITRLMRYSFTGTTSGTLDLLLLIMLVEIFHVYYLTAAAVAFIATHSFAYLINTRWGFKDSRASKHRGYYYFIFFGLIGIVLTLYLLRIGVETFNINYIIARILVGIIVGIFNFSMNYIFTFRMRKTKWKKKK